MKLSLVLLLGLILNLSVAHTAELPKAPSDCFSTNTFCSNVKVMRLNGKKLLKVEVFSKIDRKLYPDVTSVIGRFVDFYQWPQYVAGSENISFSTSDLLDTRNSDYTHRFRYTIKAPWPLRKSEIAGTTDYNESTTDYKGSLKSYSFTLDKTKPSKGLSEYNGAVHVYSMTDSHFEVSFVAFISPTIKIGLDMAKPYIQRPIQEILVGMYQ